MRPRPLSGAGTTLCLNGAAALLTGISSSGVFPAPLGASTTLAPETERLTSLTEMVPDPAPTLVELLDLSLYFSIAGLPVDLPRVLSGVDR